MSRIRSKRAIGMHQWSKLRLARNSVESRLYVNNHEVVRSPNVGNFKKINLNETMYVGTIFTEDTNSPER